MVCRNRANREGGQNCSSLSGIEFLAGKVVADVVTHFPLYEKSRRRYHSHYHQEAEDWEG